MATGWQNHKTLEVLCLRVDNWGGGGRQGDRSRERERERTHKPGITSKDMPQ